MRSVQHVDCRSAAALALPLLIDRRHASTAVAAAAAAVAIDAVAVTGATATSNCVPVADAAAAAAAAATNALRQCVLCRGPSNANQDFSCPT